MTEEGVQRLISCYKGLKDVYDGLRRYLEREREVLKAGDLDGLEAMIPERAGYFLQMSSLKEEIRRLRDDIDGLQIEEGLKTILNRAIEEAQNSFEVALAANLENINILEERKNRLKTQLYVLPRQRAALQAYEKTTRRYTKERW